jgi:hypothetical protein
VLNENGIRELAYVVVIDAIEPIVGSDNCEAAVVGGWKIMVRKNTFKANDLAVYFEIDSKVPETETYAFLAPKHYRVKTQKYTFGGKGNFISQGLLMHPNDFGWEVDVDTIKTPDGKTLQKGDFLTEYLGVTYSTVEDNKRKANPDDKYKKMAQRHSKLFAKKPYRWLMRRQWGRKLLFFFYGKKKDTRGWPEWVKKTDEERAQNIPYILENKNPWIVTEKIDGTSTTFSMKRGKHKKYDFYVCSRNVVFDKPDKECFYDTNVYMEMAEKYKVENVLRDLLETQFKDSDWVTIQGETYGEGIQKRNYSIKEHDFRAFNLITSQNGRLNSVEAAEILKPYGIQWVPIIDENYILPDTVEELLAAATGESVLDSLPREGFVFRDEFGIQSFKAVSNEFLIKYHQ